MFCYDAWLYVPLISTLLTSHNQCILFRVLWWEELLPTTMMSTLFWKERVRNWTKIILFHNLVRNMWKQFEVVEREWFHLLYITSSCFNWWVVCVNVLTMLFLTMLFCVSLQRMRKVPWPLRSPPLKLFQSISHLLTTHQVCCMSQYERTL